MTIQQETRAPFAAHTTKADKRRAGRTESADTPLEIRTGDHAIDDALRAWVYERIGRQLGKFAPQIERIQVRFGDENGDKGGIDRCCMVHVILSKLPPVIVEMRGGTDREAFDLAARSVERAMKKNVAKHGYSMRNGRHGRHGQQGNGHAAETPIAASPSPTDDVSEDSLFGKRVGRSHEQLMMLASRPEADSAIDTSEAGQSATDRKAGHGHTGRRNLKLNTAGMTRSLEDSTTDRPSRKSTRGGTNHVKPDNPLTQRTKSAVLSPKSIAGRASARGH